MNPRTLDQLLDCLPDPAQPFITYYDNSNGERVELSATTMANWVAKTSNFLVDDLDAEIGTRIRIGLPTHWLRCVWILSAWNVGAVIVDSAADIGVSGPELIGDEEQRVAASLRPLGGRFAEPPVGFLDLGVEVPGHGDHFLALDPPHPDALAVEFDGKGASHRELIAHAKPTSQRLLFEPGTMERDFPLLVNAALGGGSLVFVTSATSGALNKLASQERAILG